MQPFSSKQTKIKLYFGGGPEEYPHIHKLAKICVTKHLCSFLAKDLLLIQVKDFTIYLQQAEFPFTCLDRNITNKQKVLWGFDKQS